MPLSLFLHQEVGSFSRQNSVGLEMSRLHVGGVVNTCEAFQNKGVTLQSVSYMQKMVSSDS